MVIGRTGRSGPVIKTLGPLLIYMSVLVIVLIQDIHDTNNIENKYEERHQCLHRSERLLIYIILGIHHLVIQLLIHFLLKNPILLHVAFHVRGYVASLLLKLDKK